MDGLVVYDNELNIQLRWLAEPIRVSEDGLTYTLVLRDDLYWSDEKPLTSEDFVYTYKNTLFSDWLPFNYKDEYGLSYLFIAHNMGVIKYVSDRVVVMKASRILEEATVEEIFEAPQHSYTKSLLAAVPVPNPSLKRL